MNTANTKINTLKYILAVVIYGTIGPILHFINLPSELVVFSRGVIGTLSILVFMKILGRKVDLKAIKTNLRPLILSGFFLGLNWVFLFAAYVRISVAVASLLNYTAPIMVVIVAPFLYKERIKPLKAVCIITAFIGVVLDWISKGMPLTPQQVVTLTAAVVQGDFRNSLHNLKNLDISRYNA